MKLNRPYVLGLTGGIACGKSYVARLLRQRGIPVLDADAISRSLTTPGGEALPAVRAALVALAPALTPDAAAAEGLTPQDRDRLTAFVSDSSSSSAPPSS